jgi:hypothetical protein
MGSTYDVDAMPISSLGPINLLSTSLRKGGTRFSAELHGKSLVVVR